MCAEGLANKEEVHSYGGFISHGMEILKNFWLHYPESSAMAQAGMKMCTRPSKGRPWLEIHSPDSFIYLMSCLPLTFWSLSIRRKDRVFVTRHSWPILECSLFHRDKFSYSQDLLYVIIRRQSVQGCRDMMIQKWENNLVSQDIRL